MEIYPTTEDTAPKIVYATRINKSHVYYDCDVKECAKKYHIHGSCGDAIRNRMEYRLCEHIGKRGKPSPPSEEVMIVIDKDTVRENK